MKPGMLFFSVPLFTALLSGFSAQAQLAWQNVDSSYQPLPAGVHVYKTTSLIDGAPNIAYYLEADLKNKHLAFTAQETTGKRLTPGQFYQQEKLPLVVVNGAFFSYVTNHSNNLVMNNGTVLAQNALRYDSAGKQWRYITRGALGITASRKADIGWVFTDSTQRWPYVLLQGPSTAKGSNPHPTIHDLKWENLTGNSKPYKKWKVQTAIGGGPVLMQDGKIMTTTKEEDLFIKDVKHPRTAVGYTKDNKLIILVIQGRFPGLAEGASIAQEAVIFRDLGCYEALNLDGGGSSCLLVNGKTTIQPCDKEGQRPVPSVLLIQEKK
jgi:hypothetical protein